MPRRSVLLLVLSIILPAVTFGWLGYRIFDLQRAYFQLKTKAAAAGVAVDGLDHGDTLFVYYTAGALAVMTIALFTRYLLWRDLRRYKRLAATVSHELRTPLTTIQMYAETLAWQRVADPAKQRQYLETIARESRRLEHVVANILRYVRSDWEPRLALGQRVAAQEVAASVIERLQPWFEHSGHAVRLKGSCAAQVIADRGALEHAVENLLANAIKYSPPGSAVEVMVEQSGSRVLLQVADAGNGVPERDREAIFQEFFRAPNASADGIGLGLPLGEAHRGGASRQGVGRREHTARRALHHPVAAGGERLLMAHLLLVEDDAAIAQGLRDNLEFEGHQVTHAAEGRAGADAAG